MVEEAGLYARIEWPDRQDEVDAARHLLLSGDARNGAKAYLALSAAARRSAAAFPSGVRDRALLLRQAVRCLSHLTRFREARRLIDEGDRLARATGNPELVAAALRDRAESAWVRKDVGALASLAGEAQSHLKESPSSRARADLHAVLGRVHFVRYDYRTALREFVEAAAHARSGSPRERLAARFDLATACAAAGRHARARTLFSACRRTAQDLSPPARDAQAEALYHGGLARLFLGRELESAVADLAESCRAAHDLGLVQLHAYGLCHLSQFSLQAGWYSTALAFARRLRALRRSSLPVTAQSSRLTAAAWLALGRPDQAAPHAAAIRDRLQASGDYPNALIDVESLIAYETAAGNAAEAKRLAASAIRDAHAARRDPRAEGQWRAYLVHLHLTLASMEASSGSWPEVARLLASAGSLGFHRLPAPIRIDADLLEANRRLAAADAAGAFRAARRALARARSSGESPRLLRSAETMTRVLVRMGAANRARGVASFLRRLVDTMAARLDAGHRKDFLAALWIREATAAIRAADAARGSPIDAAHSPALGSQAAAYERAWRALAESGLTGAGNASASALHRQERELLEKALRDHGGNVSRAARSLGLHRKTLQRKMKRLGLKAATD